MPGKVQVEEHASEAEGSTEGQPTTSGEQPTCPICAFIEAGDCKEQHQVRVRGMDHEAMLLSIHS